MDKQIIANSEQITLAGESQETIPQRERQAKCVKNAQYFSDIQNQSESK